MPSGSHKRLKMRRGTHSKRRVPHTFRSKSKSHCDGPSTGPRHRDFTVSLSCFSLVPYQTRVPGFCQSPFRSSSCLRGSSPSTHVLIIVFWWCERLEKRRQSRSKDGGSAMWCSINVSTWGVFALARIRVCCRRVVLRRVVCGWRVGGVRVSRGEGVHMGATPVFSVDSVDSVIQC